MQDIIFGLDPERNPTQVRVDEKGFVRIGSSIAISRTTNPTSLADGTFTPLSADIYGRQINNIYYIRNIMTTAVATLTRASETTIMAGNATNFLDILTLTAINATGVANRIDIRSGTGGTILDSIFVGANSSATRNYTPAFPQSEIGQAWTALWSNSTGEISDSPISITMVAINNPGV